MKAIFVTKMASSTNVVRSTDIARNLAKMDTSELFFELRSITDVQQRREVTYHVHELKMRKYSNKPEWRRSMAHHLVEEVHPMFRNAFDKVLRGSSEGNVKIAQFDQVNRGLHNHHGGEDDHWFPDLRRNYPQISAELDILEKDHADLVQMERAIKAGSYTALVEFVAALNDHLNREEMLIVPHIL